MKAKEAKIAAMKIVASMIWAEVNNPTANTSADNGVFDDLGLEMKDQPKVHQAMMDIAASLNDRVAKLEDYRPTAEQMKEALLEYMKSGMGDND